MGYFILDQYQPLQQENRLQNQPWQVETTEYGLYEICINVEKDIVSQVSDLEKMEPGELECAIIRAGNLTLIGTQGYRSRKDDVVAELATTPHKYMLMQISMDKQQQLNNFFRGDHTAIARMKNHEVELLKAAKSYRTQPIAAYPELDEIEPEQNLAFGILDIDEYAHHMVKILKKLPRYKTERILIHTHVLEIPAILEIVYTK